MSDKFLEIMESLKETYMDLDRDMMSAMPPDSAGILIAIHLAVAHQLAKDYDHIGYLHTQVKIMADSLDED